MSANRCARCGAGLPPEARFCQGCGQAVAAAAAPGAPPPLPPLAGQYIPPSYGGPPPDFYEQQRAYQLQQARSSGMAVRIVVLVLVVVIGLPVLGILATIALPVLLRARSSANAEEARNDLRCIVSAEAAYYAQTGKYADLATLTSAAPPYLDARFASHTLAHGVEITEAPVGGGQTYSCTVSAGQVHYTADQTGQITTE